MYALRIDECSKMNTLVLKTVFATVDNRMNGLLQPCRRVAEALVKSVCSNRAHGKVFMVLWIQDQGE